MRKTSNRQINEQEKEEKCKKTRRKQEVNAFFKEKNEKNVKYSDK